MKNTLIAIALLLTSAQVSAELAKDILGYGLMDKCAAFSNDDVTIEVSMDMGICNGYILWVIDSIDDKLCLPSEIYYTSARYASTVLKYMVENPESLSLKAVDLISIALGEEYLCGDR